jgi:hypothetical protein
MVLSPLAHHRVRKAMRAAGAVSPASAVPRDRLPDDVRPELEWFVLHGIVREGAPDTFYLFEPRPPSPLGGVPLLRALLFWLVVLLIPVVIIQLTARTGGP